MLKRIFTFLLCGVLLFSVTACGGEIVPTDSVTLDVSDSNSESDLIGKDSDLASEDSEIFDPSSDFSSSEDGDPFWSDDSDITPDTGVLGTDDSSDTDVFNPETESDTNSSGEVSDSQTPIGSDSETDDFDDDFADSSDNSEDFLPDDDLEENSGGADTTGRKFLATDITNYGIVVFDLDACNGNYKNLANGNGAVVWEWISGEDPNLDRTGGPKYGIDSAKLRYSPSYKRDVVIACSSRGWCGVIDYDACILLWESNSSVLSNAHSIEMLPNGDLVVAISSNGSAGVAYFPLSVSDSQEPAHTINGVSCHGISWDPLNECLWVLEYSCVSAVTIQNLGTLDGKLVRVPGQSYGRFSGGHAFSPVSGQPGKYWVGAGDNLYQFDSTTKTVTQTFKYSATLQTKKIKGITSFSDGTVVIAATNLYGKSTRDWSSDGFRIVTSDGQVVGVPFAPTNREFYKVQPFTKNYQ